MEMQPQARNAKPKHFNNARHGDRLSIFLVWQCLSLVHRPHQRRFGSSRNPYSFERRGLNTSLKTTRGLCTLKYFFILIFIGILIIYFYGLAKHYNAFVILQEYYLFTISVRCIDRPSHYLIALSFGTFLCWWRRSGGIVQLLDNVRLEDLNQLLDFIEGSCCALLSLQDCQSLRSVDAS